MIFIIGWFIIAYIMIGNIFTKETAKIRSRNRINAYNTAIQRLFPVFSKDFNSQLRLDLEAARNKEYERLDKL